MSYEFYLAYEKGLYYDIRKKEKVVIIFTGFDFLQFQHDFRAFPDKKGITYYVIIRRGSAKYYDLSEARR